MFKFLFPHNRSLQGQVDDKMIVEIIIQCHMVVNRMRKAYLFQPIDLPDLDVKQRKMKKDLVLRYIQKNFPQLHKLEIEQGILFSLKKLNPNNVNSNEKLGNVLGFLCAHEYDTLNRDETVYGYHIRADVYNYGIINLVSFVCQSKNYREEFEKFCSHLSSSLVGSTSLPIFKGKRIVITNILCEVEETLSESYYIDKLLHGKRLDEQACNEIENYIWNIGLDPKIMFHFQEKNKIHRGIIVSLLCYHKYDPLKPLYPIQNTGKESQINEQYDQLSKLIIHCLENSRL